MAKKATKKTSKKAKKAATPAKQGDNSVIFGILTYIFFIIGLVWYLVDEHIRKDAFAKYHFKQSLVLAISALILWAAVGLLWFIPFLGEFIGALINLALLVLVIIGIINVANRDMKELPVIGHFARNLKF